MQAAKNTVVSLAYQLRTEQEGQVMDEATKETPFDFLFGHNQVLDLFEKNLDGKIAGNQFHFTLTPAEGYGEYDKDALVMLNKSDFMFEEEDASNMIEIGNIIPLQDQDGNPFQGRITAINGEQVTIDMNHPFAGKTLYFSGEILDVRAAHETELAHGHVHAGGGHHH